MTADIGGAPARDTNVTMVAHNGSRHDHVLLLKTIMKWGIDPPR